MDGSSKYFVEALESSLKKKKLKYLGVGQSSHGQVDIKKMTDMRWNTSLFASKNENKLVSLIDDLDTLVYYQTNKTKHAKNA